MSNDYERIQELVNCLNDCTIAYDEGHPIISDKEWDDKYFELKTLEDNTGLILGNSPTQVISYEVVNALEKATHNHKMLSLDKTKSIEDIATFIGKKQYVAMCKMDGLTCTLTYSKGKLIAAETRGNGIVGENILHNIMTLPSIPKSIPEKDLVVIDGEIVCTYTDFEQFSNEYKNPRNFAAGSIRLLDAKECAKRKLTFVAWDVIKGFDNQYLHQNLQHLIELGFTVVPYCLNFNFEDSVNNVKALSEEFSYPIDGAVFKFDDIAYGRSLGETSHHFKNAIALKFYDETYLTEVDHIEWSMGRTGILTPIAVFKPVDIEGSVVERASLHNLSIFKNSGLKYQNQKIEVFKANQIIPQIAKVYDYDCRIGSVLGMKIPKVCPICGKALTITKNNDTEFLYCSNELCEGKLINRLDHFCGKKGLDIKGLSKATLDKLIDWGWVNNFSDLFTLKKYREEWVQKPGFGEKSVDKILKAIDFSANNGEVAKIISAIGIPLIGTTASKALAEQFDYSWDKFYNAVQSKFKFYELPNFGVEMNSAIINYDYTEINSLINTYIHFNIPKNDNPSENILKDLTFVITGKLNHFKNRDMIKAKIESLGGKVTGSVSKNTNYLINNDKDSSSTKNVGAKKLGIPILSEEDFIETFGIQ